MADGFVPSGIEALDGVLQGLRMGDNVVFQVERLDDYRDFAGRFAERSVADGRGCRYIRFAPHEPVLDAGAEIELIEVDPGLGFDQFSRVVNRVIEERGRGAFYVLDNLSFLAVEWATDEQLANFYRVTCPFLYEMDCVAYFALSRGKHSHSTIAKIRDTTQVLVDVYHVGERMYVHPLKVWGRYSPAMFLPHSVEGDSWSPVFESGAAAAASAPAGRNLLHPSPASRAPWDSVLGRLEARAGNLPEGDPEVRALKKELGQMMIGGPTDFSGLAGKELGISDLMAVRARMVGSGRIGGKAAGMLLARRILANRGSFSGVDFAGVMEEHDSFYIGSDVFFTFLVENDLFRLRLKMTEECDIGDEEFEEVERRFMDGRFPPTVVEQFRNLLDYYGQAPIIVRSSSLLEDSLGNAFAGKYRSEFCANQGTPEDRLDAFMEAVKLVYASALNPDALAYRRKRGLGDSDEQMAILVQRVSGFPFGRYFLPCLAGVAFSRNLYAWGDRIDHRVGVLRLVFGLGTRAVDRVGSDYPRMVALSHPELRPEDEGSVSRYSQHLVDLINLESNSLQTLQVREVLEGGAYPGLSLLFSYDEGGYLVDPVGARLPAERGNLVLTFNNLVRRTDMVEVFRAMLGCLEEEYGHPVDVEFTATAGKDGGVRVNLLQCRPLFLPGEPVPEAVPEDIRPEKVLFCTSRMVGGGRRAGMRFILLIDPRRYSAVREGRLRAGLGRLVGRLNADPEVIEGGLVLMGPGRWGSSNIELGVNVRYSDINNASVLVEISREEAGHAPEVSYGTHFFQDLVEAGITYLPVWPDRPEANFNEGFFERSPNALLEVLPDAAEYSELARLIDVPAAAGGRLVTVAADPVARRAVMYLEP